MTASTTRLRPPPRRALTALGAAAVLAGIGVAGTAASAAPLPQTMTVHLGGGPPKASTHDLTTGWTTFDVTSGSVEKPTSYAQVFGLRPGVTLQKFQDDLAAAHGFGAGFTTALSTDTVLYGGVEVPNGATQHFSLDLKPGQYYLTNVNQQVRHLTDAFPFTVHDSTSRTHAPASKGSVLLKNMQFFPSSKSLPATGTFTLASAATNDADDVHFMELLPVVPGTTDKQIQAYFAHPAGPPSFTLHGPSALSGILSPGESMQFSYGLPAGTYAMFCFITDAETGVPHAFEGMHKVVTLG